MNDLEKRVSDLENIVSALVTNINALRGDKQAQEQAAAIEGADAKPKGKK